MRGREGGREGRREAGGDRLTPVFTRTSVSHTTPHHTTPRSVLILANSLSNLISSNSSNVNISTNFSPALSNLVQLNLLNHVAGMPAKTYETPKLLVTANKFLAGRLALKEGMNGSFASGHNNGTARVSWGHPGGRFGSWGEGTVSVSLAEIDGRLLALSEEGGGGGGAASGNGDELISNIVTVSVYGDEDEDEGGNTDNDNDNDNDNYNDNQKFTLRIPISAKSQYNNATTSLYFNSTKNMWMGGEREVTCAVNNDGEWEMREKCEVENVDLDGGFVDCKCGRGAVKYTRSRSQRRKLQDDSSSGDENQQNSLVHELGHALTRASIVLTAPLLYADLEKNVFILSFLGAIYLFYFFVTGKAIIQDQWNVYQRHNELVKSTFVHKAVEAMRENFIRLELAQKPSVLDVKPNSFDERDTGVFSSNDNFFSEKRGLDAFVNRTLDKNRFEKQISKHFLSRGSDMSSFDAAGELHSVSARLVTDHGYINYTTET